MMRFSGSPDAADPRVERRVGLGLAAVLAATFTLRLAYAGSELEASRFYDERFSLRNVSELLVRGNLRPNNAYYPSLSFLPQTAVLAVSEGLHRLTGAERLSIFDSEREDGYSATAYFLARLVAVVFGTLSVWLTFRLGRRLFSPAAGLLAATLLAATWSHVRHSAMFKPDILVVLLTLVAFRSSLDAALQPTLRRFLLAGAGVGLVASAKYNGVGVAIPLVMAGVIAGWRDRRQWAWLAAAGLAAAAIFVILNPDLPLVWEYVGRQQALYEERGTIQGSSHAGVLLEELRFLERQHGWAVLACAAAGALGLAARLAPPCADRRRRLEALMVLALVLGYSAFYAAGTTLFRGQNYLLVMPFTALLAGSTMVRLWRGLTERLRPLRSPPLAVAAWAAILALAFRFPLVETYRQLVPTTSELAERYLAQQLQPAELRRIYYERLSGEVRPFREGRSMAAVAVDSLREVPTDELDRADAEIFPAARFDEPQADFYLRRLADRRGPVRSFRPAWLSARGPELVARLHGWSLRGREALRFAPDGAGHRFRSLLPADLGPGEATSLSLWLPRPDGSRPSFELRFAGRTIEALETHVRGTRGLYLTPRIGPPADRELIVEYHPALVKPRPPEGELCRWQAPGG